MRRPLLLTLALALFAGAVPGAIAVADECDTVPEVGPRACASVEAGGIVLAGLCDRPGVVPADVCGAPRGVTVDPALVDAYEGSALATLHGLQRELGLDLPLARAQVVSSHNSYNATVYAPTVANQDPNHFYGLADQLRMDVREIELDVHTWYGADPADGMLPVLCHATGPHLGCSADRPLVEGLTEIRGWLDANPGEVVMIDVESHLDGEAGHDEAAAVVEQVLGDVLYRPVDEPCAPLPLGTSLADVRAAGAQVLLVSSCGTGGAWGGLVHTYGAWHQGRLGGFDADGCGPDYDRGQYDGAWTRYWEDTTWLSVMAGGEGPRLDAATVRAAAACGLSLASLDKLHPQDDRLEALLWSWALDAAPMDAPVGAQAVIAPDGRMRVRDAAPAGTSRTEGLLCRRPDGSYEVAALRTKLDLHVVRDAGVLDVLCGTGTLTMPRSAREMQLVREALARHEAEVGPLDADIRIAHVRTAAGWTVVG